MEESNTAESTTADTLDVKEAITNACSGDLDAETLGTLAAAVSTSEKALDDFKVVLDDWESLSKGLAKGAGVVQGYCHMLLGEPEKAEELLKGQRRNEWGAYLHARACLEANRVSDAAKAAEDAHEKFPDHLPSTYLAVELRVKQGKVEEAQKTLDKLKRSDGDSADYLYHTALVLERLGEYQEAIQTLRKAVHRDSSHAEAFFRLGYLLDLYGTEADDVNDEALNAYETCVRLHPIHTNAVMNLGVLYEDRERFHDAIRCYEAVLIRYPNHARARMYLEDALAATRMFYDKEQEKKADRQYQVLKIPVSDFELSVRSRNCLQKMNIQCLGDLIMKTEPELLSYKNFGETSLQEIKEMLAQKGLRLGQGLEVRSGDAPVGRNPLEATAAPEVLDKPIEELELSVRSRRCMERLEVRTVRDLINKTEVELMSAKNFGMTSLNEIKKTLADLGLCLRS
ncbi:MAG: tetratricopeptide repeat protein [Planctomycetes bacterium]|nr:tetratricopeptide repeat protein [Planctomycetota bacterium]